MRWRSSLAIVAVAAALLTRSLTPALAQGASPTPDDEAHRAAFDYLLGDWEFTGERELEAGKLAFRGFWTATRTPGGRTLVDEYRVVDDTGRTGYVTTTLRAYHPSEHRWSIVSIEPSGAFAEGRAWQDGADVRIEQKFERGLMRFRYYDIKPDRFSWVGELPNEKGEYAVFQRIEARRVGPPRAGVLAVAPAPRGAGAAKP